MENKVKYYIYCRFGNKNKLKEEAKKEIENAERNSRNIYRRNFK